MQFRVNHASILKEGGKEREKGVRKGKSGKTYPTISHLGIVRVPILATFIVNIA
jgi:hypothetical protein